MSGLPPTFSGDLAKVPVTKLLYRIAVAQQTGRLDIKLAEIEKSLYFKKGDVVGVVSNSPEETVTGILSAKYKLSYEQLKELSEAEKAGGGAFDQMVFSTGCIQPSDYFGFLTSIAEMRITNALLWREGQYSFFSETGPDPAAAPIRLKVFPLLGQGMRASIDEKSALIILTMVKDGRAQPINNPLLSINDLSLSAKELRIYSLVQEYETMKAAAEGIIKKDRSIKVEEIIQVVYLLWQLDLLALVKGNDKPPEKKVPEKEAIKPKASAKAMASVGAEAKKAGEPSKEAAAPKPIVEKIPTDKKATEPAKTDEAGKTEGPPQLPLTAEALVERHKASEAQDYFGILGVAREANDAVIKKSYLSLARVFHPDNMRNKVSGDNMHMAEEYFARVSEAYQVLSNKEQREEYLAKLKLKEEGSAHVNEGGEVDIKKILNAEELFVKAKLALKGNGFIKAAEYLEEALKSAPEEAEYKGYYAWAAYNTTVNGEKREEAKNMLKEIVEQESKVADFYYFYGYMLRLEGRPDEAMKYYRKTLSVDRYHQKAMQEIRFINMKKSRAAEEAKTKAQK